ncbi:unnamed protein product [Mytilus edulis]|uniref:Uncharacterized protein n=1 Tax=Mytilus edulis TaxID=6550 RepID=A0A8S3PQB6_MYTED|nr:unnamed protein product [Mytilus edulis]
MELRKMRKTFSMGDLHPSSKNTRSYTLDKEKALQKKSEACKRQHLMYELKSGKNFVVEMSTGAYEIIKKEIHEILYNSEECKSYSVVQKQDGVENAGLTVDSCYRVYNKKQNGQVGTMLKFTINLYHTSCSMNVNGKIVDLFINDIFDSLCEKVKGIQRNRTPQPKIQHYCGSQPVNDINSNREKDHPQNADNAKKNKDTNIASCEIVQCTRKLISVDENTLNESSQNAFQPDPEEETILKSVESPKPSKTGKRLTDDNTAGQPNDKKMEGKHQYKQVRRENVLNPIQQ